MILPGTSIKQSVQLPSTPGDCWGWRGAVDRGVAVKCMGGKMTTARRWMWLTLFGPIPPALVVTTTCGSATCTNPHHLRACPHADALREGMSATLLPADVAEIRRARKDRGPNTSRILAERYGVTPQTIRAVWSGSRWARKRRTRTTTLTGESNG